MMQTERVTFLTTAENKAALDAFAASHGTSVGHVLREATSRYIAQGQDDNIELAAIVDELVTAIPDMKARLERTAALIENAIEDSDRRLRAAGVRK